MKSQYTFSRRVLDGETVSIEADSLEDAVHILETFRPEAETMPLASFQWGDVEIMDAEGTLFSEPFPRPQVAESWDERAYLACAGLDLPPGLPEGVMAELLAAAQEAARELSFRGFEGVCPRLGAVLLKLYVPKDNGVPVSPPPVADTAEPRQLAPGERVHVATYHTQRGLVALEIHRCGAARGTSYYSYTGKHGAGSGHPAKHTAETVKLMFRSHRGVYLAEGQLDEMRAAGLTPRV